MTAKIIGGYSFREQFSRVESATRITRQSLEQIINYPQNEELRTALVAKIATSQMTVLEALREIEKIAGQKSP